MVAMRRGGTEDIIPLHCRCSMSTAQGSVTAGHGSGVKPLQVVCVSKTSF